MRCESLIPCRNPRDLPQPILHHLLIRTLRSARESTIPTSPPSAHAASPEISPSPSTASPGRAACPSIPIVWTPLRRALLLRRAIWPGPRRLHVDARSHSSKRSGHYCLSKTIVE